MAVDKRRVLDKVNAARVALGGAPLSQIAQGRSIGADCPLANSLKDLLPGAAVRSSSILGVPEAQRVKFAAAVGGTVRGDVVYNPTEFRQFVDEFDSGRAHQELRRF
jgi:hypothetical protein